MTKKNAKSTAAVSTKSNKFAAVSTKNTATKIINPRAKFEAQHPEIKSEVLRLPAKKTAAKKAAAPTKKPVASAARFDDSAKIVLLVKENPRREGSKAWKYFELYRKPGMTVGKYAAAGGDRGYLKNDAGKRKLIRIA